MKRVDTVIEDLDILLKIENGNPKVKEAVDLAAALRLKMIDVSRVVK